jgi:ubiquinone/menaquinone biosynthesis C-methylase UbiE
MGTFTLEAAQRGARAIGFDMMPTALQAARRVASEEQVTDAQFVLADVVRLPVRSAAADVVVAADLTEHLDPATLDGMLAETRRALRPDGRLVLYTPQATHIFERLRDAGVLKQDPSHIAVRSGEELATAVRAAGYTIERITYLPSHLPGWNLLERAFARWVPLLRRRLGIVARPVS